MQYRGMTNPYAAGLRGQMPMSEEERRRQQQLAALQQQAAAVGVTPQQVQAEMPGAATRYAGRKMSDAEGDVNRLGRRYKSQMAFAQGLRDTAMPEGRKVGPSGIYVQNPWESATAALSKLTGAYLENRIGETTGKELSSAERALRRATTEQESAQRQEERAFERAMMGEKYGYEGEMLDTRLGAESDLLDRRLGSESDLLDRRLGAEGQLLDRRLGAQADLQTEQLESEEARLKTRLEAEAEQNRLQRDLERELADPKTDLTLNLTGYDDLTRESIDNLPSAGERKDVTKALTALSGLNKAMELGDSVYAQGGDWTGGGDIGIGFITDFFGEETKPAVRSFLRGMTKDKDELSVKAAISEAYEQLRRAATGANLTGVEIAFSSDYDPSTPGIDEEEALSRLQFISERVNDGLEARGVPRQETYSYTSFGVEDDDDDDELNTRMSRYR